MKGIRFHHVDAPSVCLGGVLGIVGGGLLGYVLAKRTLRAKFATDLDTEIEEIKSHYNGHLRKLLGSEDTGAPYVGAKRSWADVIKNTLEPVPAPMLRPKDTGYGAGPHHRNGGAEEPGTPVPDVSGEDPTEGLNQEDIVDEVFSGGDEDLIAADIQVDSFVITENRNHGDKPYVISAEELGEPPNPGWQQLTITYYAGDQVLADDKDQPIRDIRGTVGSVELITFGGPSGDPHLKYVRNEKLEIDFEIVYDRRSYADVVLNYGQPNRQRTAADTS